MRLKSVKADTVQIIVLFYPRERNTSSSKEVKQAARSGNNEARKERRKSPDAEKNCPPGSRDRSNVSCSSVWPATTWGVTKTDKKG